MNENIKKVDQLIDEGLHCYHEGNLSGALVVFEQLLEIDNNNIELLHTLVKLLQEMKDFGKAVEYGEKLLSLSPDNSDFMLSQAENYYYLQCYESALPLYLKLQESHPAEIHVLARLSSIYEALYELSEGDNNESDIWAIESTNELIDSVVFTCSKMIKQDKGDQASKLLNGVLLIDSGNARANALFGYVLRENEEFEQAFHYLDKAVSQGFFDCLDILAEVIEESYGTPAFIYYLEKLSKKFPDDNVIKKYLGYFNYKNDSFHKAYEYFSAVVEDDDSDIVFRKYKALARYKSVDESKQWFDKNALVAAANELFTLFKLMPRDTEIAADLVRFYMNIGEIRKSYEVSCSLDKYISSHKENEWNKHFYYLALRDKDSFYKAYLCGRSLRFKSNFDSFKKRIWNGEPIAGKKVFLLREQGIGDELYFASNYQWLIEQGAIVKAYCRERLLVPFERLFPEISFIPMNEKNARTLKNMDASVLADADVIVLSGDLPALHYQAYGHALFNKDYYWVEHSLKKKWKRKLDSIIATDRPRVGIAWRSGLVYGSRATYYLSADEMAIVISKLPEVEFINCMYAECSEELDKIEKLTGRVVYNIDELDQRDDFENTAAMLSNLDLVLGAHIAPIILAEAVGTRTVIYGADYLPENGELVKESLNYPGTPHISLPVNNSAKRAQAIDGIVDSVRKLLNI
ncbi:lipopolysaccharide assembly protein LapB [Oceanimonas sp. GK1]|uniref:tetratricopeptide repeat protein n=1 Tax=Oceanimonas sp. (strain GK1 / IBRC-M 10197) TaxID=511062 RepID=UPI0013052C12|nr:hypothetical protein [Oceanimonas sp. GK1]